LCDLHEENHLMKLSVCIEMFSIGKLVLGFNKLEQIFVAGFSHLNLHYSYTASLCVWGLPIDRDSKH